MIRLMKEGHSDNISAETDDNDSVLSTIISFWSSILADWVDTIIIRCSEPPAVNFVLGIFWLEHNSDSGGCLRHENVRCYMNYWCVQIGNSMLLKLLDLYLLTCWATGSITKCAETVSLGVAVTGQSLSTESSSNQWTSQESNCIQSVNKVFFSHCRLLETLYRLKLFYDFNFRKSPFWSSYNQHYVYDELLIS